MNRIVRKSAIYGVALGALLFAITPLGLGIYLIEVLKPVLAPGLMVVQLFLRNPSGAAPIILALVSNMLIFFLLFLAYFSIRSKPE